MFGFIRKWWRRRSRLYRCDDCGKIVKRSEKRAAVRIEPVKRGQETTELTKTLDRTRELRMSPGMQKIVLSCPACVEKRAKVILERGQAMVENFKEAFDGAA